MVLSKSEVKLRVMLGDNFFWLGQEKPTILVSITLYRDREYITLFKDISQLKEGRKSVEHKFAAI